VLADLDLGSKQLDSESEDFLGFWILSK
jgi:hypothetical protein